MTIERAQEEMRSSVNVFRYIADVVDGIANLERKYDFEFLKLGELVERARNQVNNDNIVELFPTIHTYTSVLDLLKEFSNVFQYRPSQKKDYAKRMYEYCNKMDCMIGMSYLALRPRDLNEVLVNSCSDKNFQNTVDDAFKYLEDILRDKVEAGTEYYGVRLVEYVLDPDNGKVILSDDRRDRVGYFNLFKGAFQSIRNTYGHSLKQDQRMDAAIKVMHFVDMLIKIIERGKLRS